MSELVHEREFLLRSLRDLEAEKAAGDIDDVDYETLRRDYTARAAAVIRALREPAAAPKGVSPPPGDTRPTRSRWKVPVATGLVVGLAVLAGWAVASSSGDRTPGQTITGSLPGQGTTGSTASSAAAAVASGTTVDDKLNQARQLLSNGNAADAVKAYDDVLKIAPEQPEALAYKGWLLHLAGVEQPALDSLTKAEQADPTYPDAHFFRGEVLCTYLHDQAGAIAEYNQFLNNDPPPDFVTEVQQRLKNAQSGSCTAAKIDFGPPPPGSATPTTAPIPGLTTGPTTKP